MSLLQVAISCQSMSRLKQKQGTVTMIQYIFWIYKTYSLRLTCSLMQQAVCCVEIKKKKCSKDQQWEKFTRFHLFTALYFLIAKKMQAPRSKALKHILNFTDKNCSSSQASTCMLCQLRALDHSLT